ncbi:zinc ribbon domain-containing protein [uncultured Selenomonas sp.]|uniref:zinc ribbon domain-containing protein n=1 Tax=uncultured Selenomonas sp. TaxID=159275 RepID=UPI0025CEBECC|nr:zinc ribbon domain-containing protein [uncultured Selenomonas sp.]
MKDEEQEDAAMYLNLLRSTIESRQFFDAWEQDLKEDFEGQIPEAEDVSQEALAAPAESASTCTNCGATLMPNAKFCSECGAPVPKPEPVRPTHCPICGTELAERAKFCSECGYKIEG